MNRQPSQKNVEWAATMHGVPLDGGAVCTHAGEPHHIGRAGAVRREEREQLEDRLLAPGATRAHGAGNRPVTEPPDDYRTCFERDRDRIVASSAFRRLAGKTQVFVRPNDHQRTRLTHALEVAQVAVGIAQALRLNVALTEAIALGHDCGHGPFGHTSEDAFEHYIPEFSHAVWGADVTLAGLNLCAETSDGIRNHSWSRPRPATPEAVCVSLGDRVAYNFHDFEDAVAAGILTPADLPDIVAERAGTSRGAQIRAFIDDIVTTTVTTGQLAMSAPMAEALAVMRATNYQRVYMRPESLAQAELVVPMLRNLVDYFIDHPDQVADPVAGVAPGSVAAAHHAVAYVSGMTDRYAKDQAIVLLGWEPPALLGGIDLSNHPPAR